MRYFNIQELVHLKNVVRGPYLFLVCFMLFMIFNTILFCKIKIFIMITIFLFILMYFFSLHIDIRPASNILLQHRLVVLKVVQHVDDPKGIQNDDHKEEHYEPRGMHVEEQVVDILIDPKETASDVVVGPYVV